MPEGKRKKGQLLPRCQACFLTSAVAEREQQRVGHGVLSAGDPPSKKHEQLEENGIFFPLP